MTTDLDLISTPDLIAALERRFDTLVFAGTILLRSIPGAFQEQRVVRRKGHDLIQVGLVHVLMEYCQPQPLTQDTGTIGGPDGGRDGPQ